jgi:phosphoglucomutase
MQDQAQINWQDRAHLWANDPFLSPKDQNELQNLLKNSDPKSHQQLEEMFFQELEFGTAGLRGIVGLGTNRMNIYNIKRATHALALSIKELAPNQGIKTPYKVAISCDSRLSSEEFSLAAAEILSAHGITAYLVNRPTATPILSFAVRHLKCVAGIMVTASHNPKDYNGYKVYWSDGAQITAPVDKCIMQHYKKIKNLSEIPIFDNKIHTRWLDMPESVYETYHQLLLESCLQPDLCRSEGELLKIVYTPLHGTGAEPVKRALYTLGFKNLTLVESQAKPDGNFPTTDYPNPEDPKALTLAKNLLTEIQGDVAIGSDPDTDRMGAIVKTDHGYEFLSGNDIANFLLFYKLEILKSQKKLTSNSLVLKSIVTSTFQDALCKKYGVQLVPTLTGFKWMAGYLRECELKQQKFDFVFASEESFGSMPNDFVRDKDGVAAATLLCEALLHFKTLGKNFSAIKKSLYEEMGQYYDHVLNFQFPGVKGLMSMKNLMEKLKNPELPSHIPWKLDSVEDYQLGYSFKLKGPHLDKVPLTLPKTSMLGLVFENGSKVYVRPSGTEPKIKFYLLFHGNNLSELKNVAENIKQWIDELIKNCN